MSAWRCQHRDVRPLLFGDAQGLLTPPAVDPEPLTGQFELIRRVCQPCIDCKDQRFGRHSNPCTDPWYMETRHILAT
jgi:hypothetical protein